MMGCFTTSKLEKQRSSSAPRSGYGRAGHVAASPREYFSLSLLSNKPVVLPDPDHLQNEHWKSGPVARTTTRFAKRGSFSGPIVSSASTHKEAITRHESVSDVEGGRTLRRATSFGGRPQPLPLPVAENSNNVAVPKLQPVQTVYNLPVPEASAAKRPSIKREVAAAVARRVTPVAGGLPLPPPSLAGTKLLQPSLAAFEYRHLVLATDDFAASYCVSKSATSGDVFLARIEDHSTGTASPRAKLDVALLRLPENSQQENGSSTNHGESAMYASLKIENGQKVVEMINTFVENGDDWLHISLPRFSISTESIVSEEGATEWKSEVQLLAQISHPNVCAVKGYCAHECAGSRLSPRGARRRQERLLVFAQPSNGSLYDHLFGMRSRSDTSVLDWDTRVDIALGAAHGLLYIHDLSAPLQIVFHEFSASTVLLENDYAPKLAGYGLSVIVPPVHRFTSNTMQEKRNVRSFGVLLLELLSGKSSRDAIYFGEDGNFVRWGREFMKDSVGSLSRLAQIIDPRMKVPTNGAMEVARLSLRCVSRRDVERPSLAEIVAALESIKAKHYSNPKLRQIFMENQMQTSSLDANSSSENEDLASTTPRSFTYGV